MNIKTLDKEKNLASFLKRKRVEIKYLISLSPFALLPIYREG